VVGIDRNREVLTLAAERARAVGLRQISFEQAAVESFSSQETFDLVIARAVSSRVNKPENNDPGLLEEGEMEQVGRLI
jgi:2-polyprenyl-3-methyl-5-hydroxy-6-metoxy-1,4-benzoquinol methylase